LSPEHREYAELMLDRARAELRAAEQLVAIEDWDENIVGFHLHQAVEKALKAVLAGNEIEIPYTHDLAKLCSAVSTNEIEVPGSVAAILWLTP
jgi:HEPN domain-containing protein